MRPHDPMHRLQLSIVLFGILCAVNAYMALTFVPGGKLPWVSGFDESCYFAYGHSLLFDGDLDFANEYRFIVPHQLKTLGNKFAELLQEKPVRPDNVFNAGTGLAAIPVLAVVRVGVWVHDVATGGKTSPFAPIYALAYYVANILYGTLALLIAARVLRRWFSPGACAFGVWTAVLCGPFAYYMVFSPGMSHLTGAFFGISAVACWLRWRDQGRHATLFAVLLGFCVGFAVCVRPYSMPLGLLLLEPVVMAAFRRRGEPRRVTLQSALAVLAAFLGFLPQLVIWRFQTGHWIANTTDYHFYLWPPYLLNVLFSRRHGLFFWAPAYLVAIIGLIFWARRQPTPAVVVLLLFAGAAYMYGNWWYYWIGVAFGMRGFVDYFYVFAFGFAALFAGAVTRWGDETRRLCVLVALIFVIVNVHLSVAFRCGAITVDGPLYWSDTVGNGANYKERLRRDWHQWTDFSSDLRAPLLTKNQEH